MPCAYVWRRSFSSLEPTILLACGRDQELWPDPIFWVCAEYSFRILNQSDLPDLTESPWIVDFRCWTKPELSCVAWRFKLRLWCFLSWPVSRFPSAALCVRVQIALTSKLRRLELSIDPCHRPEGSWALGTRMTRAYIRKQDRQLTREPETGKDTLSSTPRQEHIT